MKKLIIILLCLTYIGCSKGEGGEENPQPTPGPSPGGENPENSPPETPLLIFPYEDELCVDSELKFEWEKSSDSDNHTVTYGLQISTNRSFTEIVENQVVNSTNTTLVMEGGQDYYWRVRAIDSENAKSEYSPTWAFYVEGDVISNHVPYISSLVAPTMASEVNPGSVVLEWQGSDIDDDQLLFDIYFGNSDPPELYQSGFPQNSIEVDISPNASYYWKVNVFDGNATSYGEIWKFTTID